MKKLILAILFFLLSMNSIVANVNSDDYEIIKLKYTWIDNITFSEDWKHYAFEAIKKNLKIVLVKDWEELYEWEYGWIGDIKFSNDWKSVVFEAKNFNWNYVVVKDWKELGWEYEEIWNIIFSDDWKSVAFLGVKENWKRVVVKNWEELWWEYDYISDMIFSDDWKNIAFIAGKDIEQYRRHYVVVKNWEELGWGYDNISDIIFSDDWKNVIYYTEDNWTILKSLFKDWEKIWSKYERIWKYERIGDVTFSGDWKHYAFIAEKENWNRVVVKDWEELWWEYEKIDYITLSKDWKHYAFVGKKWYFQYVIVKDGEELGRKYEKISNITFSDDWKHYAFAGKKEMFNWNYVVIKDGKELWWEYEDIDDIIFSDDWENIVLIEKRNYGLKKVLIKDWRQLWREYKGISDIIFLDDWKSVVFKGKKENWQEVVVKDGEELWGEYSEIKNITFSEDWKNVVFSAEIFDWNDIVVKDGEEIWELWKVAVFNNWSIASLIVENEKEYVVIDDKKYATGYTWGSNITTDNINKVYVLNSSTELDDNTLLSGTSKVKWPKEITKNPSLVIVNWILAFLYLFTFYFFAQLFNGYFEESSDDNNFNKRISERCKKIIKFIPNKIYNLLLKKANKKQWKYLNALKNFLVKYQHKIYILLWLFFLWIIGQIIIDDFNIFSIHGLFTIVILMFVLAFATLLKDLILYSRYKRKTGDELKLENNPLWFIVALLVAIIGRTIWMIPWVLFWSVMTLKTSSNEILKKISSPKALINSLLITFWIWLIIWISTVFFAEGSFTYKFLIVTYFWLINDVFFALLPVWFMCWAYIFKSKETTKFIKIEWFVLTYITFFFLLHTILHSEWDLKKLLEFDWNFAILTKILIFLIFITWLMHFINRKKLPHNNKV